MVDQHSITNIFNQACYLICFPNIILIREGNIFSLAQAYCLFEIQGVTEVVFVFIRLQSFILIGIALQNVPGAICGTIIHRNNFDIYVRLRKKAIQLPGQEPFPVVST